MPSQRERNIRGVARHLARQVTPARDPAALSPPPEYQPISRNHPDWPLPRVRRAYVRGRPGHPKTPEPVVLFLMKMTRREKHRWKRAAQDLGIPLSGMIRLAMRYFMSSSRMQQIIRLGPREIEFRKRVHAHTLMQRMTTVIGPEQDPEAVPDPAVVRKRYDKPKPQTTEIRAAVKAGRRLMIVPKGSE